MSDARRPNRRAHTVRGSILLAFLACASGADAAPPVVRFVDLAVPPAVRAVTIDGERKRILEPFKSEHVFPLQEVPPTPLLSFAVGRRPFEGASTVRFEIWLRRADAPSKQLYAKEVSAPGWIDERIDLQKESLANGELLFVRTMVGAAGGQLFGSVWGDPVLVSGAPTGATSVVLISLDTLRADRLGVHGNAAARTPHLDALARAGVWYSNAYSPSTWTYPSHEALFFGVHPATRPCPDPSGPQPKSKPCPDAYQPLAELFRQNGHVTAGFTGGGYLSYNFGFSRGFDTYYMFPQPPAKRGDCRPELLDGREVFPRAIKWLRARGRVPFFLLIHTYDPHDRCPFRTSDKDAFQWDFDGTDGRARFLRYYDELISATDANVGAVLKTLEEIGMADSTLVVVTSDHGEGLGEHGFKGHGCPYKPYDELSRVPLMMRWPKRLPAGTRIDQPVPLVDVATSILALTATPSRAPTDGVALPGLGLPPAEARPTYVHCGDVLAVRRGKHKLLTSRAGAFPDELYDLEADPGETTSRIDGNAAHVDQLRQDAAAYWKRLPATPDQAEDPHLNLDEETKERLRALGYQ